jgi:uncharacterized protein with HEPN domain
VRRTATERMRDILECIEAIDRAEATALRYLDDPYGSRMRDLIGHHYYKLDPQIVRATVGQPIGQLRAACEAILAESVMQDEPEP